MSHRPWTIANLRRYNELCKAGRTTDRAERNELEKIFLGVDVISGLLDVISDLRDGLEFYADRDNFLDGKEYEGEGDWADMGDHARELLARSE